MHPSALYSMNFYGKCFKTSAPRLLVIVILFFPLPKHNMTRETDVNFFFSGYFQSFFWQTTFFSPLSPLLTELVHQNTDLLCNKRINLNTLPHALPYVTLKPNSYSINPPTPYIITLSLPSSPFLNSLPKYKYKFKAYPHFKEFQYILLHKIE